MINIEAKRQPDATKSKISRICLLEFERERVSDKIPRVELETETRMLLSEFFKINQRDM
jgi:hypothetical protein